MKPSTLLVSFLAGSASLFMASAQTTTPRSAAHSAMPAHRAAAVAACAKLPELSPEIPPLPAGLPCAKPLYTLTRRPDLLLDYASPLLGPELRASLDAKTETFSLNYVDTKIGSGPLALPHMWYTVHYSGYLANGTKFDSSVDRGEPISFPYGGHRVIPGWDTGFEGMHVGGKRRLFVPYELAYGENGRAPTIPARALLVFDLELVSQSETQPAPKTSPVTTPPASKPLATPAQPNPAAPGAAAPAPKPSATPPSGSPQR